MSLNQSFISDFSEYSRWSQSISSITSIFQRHMVFTTDPEAF